MPYQTTIIISLLVPCLSTLFYAQKLITLPYYEHHLSQAASPRTPHVHLFSCHANTNVILLVSRLELQSLTN